LLCNMSTISGMHTSSCHGLQFTCRCTIMTLV
jgi:hypothetical protein